MSSDIRWLLRKDMKHLLKLEGSTGWSEAEILEVCKERNVIGLVNDAGGVNAYVLYRLHKQFLEIVHFNSKTPESLISLVERLKEKTENGNRNYLVVFISEWSLNLQLLFRDMGFKAVDILHQDKRDEYLMEWKNPAKTQWLGVNRISAYA